MPRQYPLCSVRHDEDRLTQSQLTKVIAEVTNPFALSLRIGLREVGKIVTEVLLLGVQIKGGIHPNTSVTSRATERRSSVGSFV